MKDQRLEKALRRIHFHDLEIFECVARLGSVSAASREMKLLAPHVSKSLKRVESAIGAVLFIRSPQGVALTPEGRQFLDLCESLFQVVSAAEWSGTADKSPTRTRLLSIAGASFLVSHLAARVIPKLVGVRKLYDFRILHAPEEQLLPLGVRGLFDCAFHVSNPQWPRTWTSIPIGNIQWILCGRSGHPAGPLASEREVARFKFVTPTHASPAGYQFGEDNCPLPVRQRLRGDQVPNAELGLQLASHSDQLVFVPEVVARDWIDSRKIQKIQVRQWTPVLETIYLSAHSERVANPFFRELARVYGGSL